MDGARHKGKSVGVLGPADSNSRPQRICKMRRLDCRTFKVLLSSAKFVGFYKPHTVYSNGIDLRMKRKPQESEKQETGVEKGLNVHYPL